MRSNKTNNNHKVVVKTHKNLCSKIHSLSYLSFMVFSGFISGSHRLFYYYPQPASVTDPEVDWFCYVSVLLGLRCLLGPIDRCLRLSIGPGCLLYFSHEENSKSCISRLTSSSSYILPHWKLRQIAHTLRKYNSCYVQIKIRHTVESARQNLQISAK